VPESSQHGVVVVEVRRPGEVGVDSTGAAYTREAAFFQRRRSSGYTRARHACVAANVVREEEHSRSMDDIHACLPRPMKVQAGEKRQRQKRDVAIQRRKAAGMLVDDGDKCSALERNGDVTQRPALVYELS